MRGGNVKNLEASVVLVDKNGLIVGCNSFARIALGETELKGKNISVYREAIKKKNTYSSNMGDYTIYAFAGVTKYFTKAFVDGISVPFALFGVDGRISYYNAAFAKMFSDVSKGIWEKVTIEEVINAYAVNNISLDFLKRIKKDITIKMEMGNGTAIGKVKVITSKKNEPMAIMFSCEYIEKTIALESKILEVKEELKAIKGSKTIADENDGVEIVDFGSTNPQYKSAMNLAQKDITVLILGESGTGKSYLAKKMHEESCRSNGNFVTINCASIPESLIESELFGYEEGAFTGASSGGKKGLVEIADGGTLFLDEIAELPMAVQSKFLHLIQDKEFTPVGGTFSKKVDVRILTATNKELENEIQQKRFRQDLYYRIAVATVVMPPLRERKGELERFMHMFLDKFNKKHNGNARLSREAKACLMTYKWPGNIRELENLMEFLAVSNDGEITKSGLPFAVLQSVEDVNVESFVKDAPEQMEVKIEEQQSLDLLLYSYEKSIVERAYEKNNSSYKLAKALSISQTKANKLINKYIKNSKA